MGWNGLPLVDLGNAPRIFVNGLARVIPMGPNALFTFFVIKPTSHEESGIQRLVEVELIAPIEAVGLAFDTAINTLGVSSIMRMTGKASHLS